MYKDYVIMATALLVIALVFAGIRVRRYNWPCLHFVGGIVMAAFLFTDPSLVGNSYPNKAAYKEEAWFLKNKSFTLRIGHEKVKFLVE